MTRVCNSGCSDALRRIVLWVLVLMLPLQGMAATLRTALGPLHVHRYAEVQHVDFSHGTPVRPTDDNQVLVSAAHGHDDAAPARHHHSHDDASVERLGNDTADDGDAAAPAVAPFAALMPSACSWQTSDAAHVYAMCNAWPLLTHVPMAIERPPRAA